MSEQNAKRHNEIRIPGMSRDLCQELYNSIPGAPAVKRLRNRPYAIERIWAAMQGLEPKAVPPAELVSDNTEMPKTNKQSRSRARKAAAAPKTARLTRKVSSGHREPPKEGTRQATVIAMLQRKSGLTIGELQDKFGWKSHTCRGLISTINAKGWASVTSETNKAGSRVYRAS